MVAASHPLTEQARAVSPHRRLQNPRSFHDLIHEFEPAIAILIRSVDEIVEQRIRADRLAFPAREVENHGVVLAAGDLEIHRDDEGLRRALRGAERVHDAVVAARKEVVELAVGSHPINASGIEEPLAGGSFALFGRVIRSADGEEVAGRRGPAVGSGVEIHVFQGSAVDRFLPPIFHGGRGRGRALGVVVHLHVFRRAHSTVVDTLSRRRSRKLRRD